MPFPQGAASNRLQDKTFSRDQRRWKRVMSANFIIFDFWAAMRQLKAGLRSEERVPSRWLRRVRVELMVRSSPVPADVI